MSTENTAPRPQAGTWTLTAPDGRQWRAESPLKCASLEQRERIPAHLALQRFFEAAAEASDPPSPWIPVAERLPEDDCEVIAYGPTMGMFGTPQVMSTWFRRGRGQFGRGGVTHWMPLPAAPAL